jgi:hypothetical protein
MSKAIAFVVAICAAVSASAQEPRTTFNMELKVPLEARTLKGLPYSAEIVNDHAQVFSDGNRILQHSTGRVYRDTEGRVRREEDRASGNPSISIVDPVAGVSYSLDPENHVAWKTAAQTGVAIMSNLYNGLDGTKIQAEMKRIEGLAIERKNYATAKQGAETMTIETSGGAVSIRRSNGGEQRSEETLASRMIGGVRADGHRTTTTIPAGAIGNEWPITTTSEEWTSPELQLLVLTDRKDPRNGDATYRLEHIVREEPAPSLFQVPSDYTVKETGIRRFDLQRQD